MDLSQQQINHFWHSVEKIENGCWVWKRGRSSRGYGKCTINRQHMRAHRVAWIISNGDIPGNMWVLHRCDNPPCVRPDHLFLGTHQDNTDDKVKKGRQACGEALTHRKALMPRGEQHGMSKLTTEIVQEIRVLYPTLGASLLAKKYQVDRTTIWHIAIKRTWKHVPDKVVTNG